MTIVTPNNIDKCQYQVHGMNPITKKWWTNYVTENKWMGWMTQRQRHMDCKAISQNSWGDQNILYLDYGGSFTDLYNSQNSPNCTFYIDSVYANCSSIKHKR